MVKLKSVDELFGGRHFDREVIILCVHWYLRDKLSLRDLEEMMAEGSGQNRRRLYPIRLKVAGSHSLGPARG